MELNKPLSVHMTHEEYEQYKKYLSIQYDITGVIVHIGYCSVGLKILNESEIIQQLREKIERQRLYIAESEKLIKNLQDAKPTRRWYQIWN